MAEVKTDGKLVGYARVSTGDQSLQLQLDALEQAGCHPIYKEVASGSRRDRPELERMLKSLEPGQTVVVWKLDRLGRSMTHMVQVMDDLLKRGTKIKSLTEGIDTSTTAGLMVAHVISAIASYERSLIIERTKAGMVAAKAQGRVGGRPAKITQQKKDMIVAMQNMKLTHTQIAEHIGISRMTLHRWLDKMEDERKSGQE